MAKFSATQLDIFLALILSGIALGYSVSGLPPSIVWACVIWAGVWVCLSHLFFIHDATASCPLIVKLVIWGAATFLILAVSWTPARIQYAKEHAPPPAPVPSPEPDVALRFVDPKHPSLAIDNISDAVARNIKWEVVLWNMEHLDQTDPLPIPTATFDFIKPHDESGFEEIFGSLAASLKAGDKLIGSAVVDCPECVSGKTYMLYIVWGKGGWYSPLPQAPGKLFMPVKPTKRGLLVYFATLNKLAKTVNHIQIGER